MRIGMALVRCGRCSESGSLGSIHWRRGLLAVLDRLGSSWSSGVIWKRGVVHGLFLNLALGVCISGSIRLLVLHRRAARRDRAGSRGRLCWR